MIDKRLFPVLPTMAGVVSIIFLSLGTAQAADSMQSNNDKPVATVNGTVLTAHDLDAFIKAMSAPRGQQMPREEALNTMIDRELLYQEAVSKGLDKKPDVIQELNDQRRSLLANIAITEMLGTKPPTEEELRKVYQDRILAKKPNEYKARHILVKTEGEAKDIIAQLDKGADFSALAKAKSTDTGSATHGGDLGWFASAQMVPEFANATAALEKGKYTKTPVKSQFGWHVIMLDDTRPLTPPTFDEIKSRLEGVVQSERVSDYVRGLRQKAKIENK